MFCYKRKNVFIDYYINGIKSRSIGIVKQKLESDTLELIMEITGSAEWKNHLCKVSIGDGQREDKLGDIHICNGRGSSVVLIPQKEWKASYYKKLFFAFGNDCYGVADIVELPESDKEATVNTEKLPEIVKEEIVDVEKVPEPNEEEPVNAERVTDAEEPEEELPAECLEPQPDKWEVIKKKYPILYPFKGQGPYVSIKPVDLQLLSAKYQHLNQNSYLMHGFYQYRHMILGEYTQEKGTFFYVGVPGEFIKKEQTSAAMFGFEGYEHSGDLGYYLYRVEL